MILDGTACEGCYKGRQNERLPPITQEESPGKPDLICILLDLDTLHHFHLSS